MPALTQPRRAPHRGQRGVTLVESLVALLVLSVGMLGIAALFVSSVRYNRTALLRTQAINLVSDMADRIRANATARAAYDLPSYGTAPATLDCAPSDSAAGDNCTIAQLAEDDLARWIAAVQAALPPPGDDDPPALVEFTPAAGGGPDRYTVQVRWQEPGETAPFAYSGEVLVMPRTPPT
ncbi:MAG: type IV pilus modification protein PilV [Steroidobacteraceae bacterium]